MRGPNEPWLFKAQIKMDAMLAFTLFSLFFFLNYFLGLKLFWDFCVIFCFIQSMQ